MSARRRNPRILFVTPEISYVPEAMGTSAGEVHAKSGGLADAVASLVSELSDAGLDVHVALPHYRRLFEVDIESFSDRQLRRYKRVLPNSRLHLAQDRRFFYRRDVYSSYSFPSADTSLIFQREVIHHILPRVEPDLVHCHDWMTGLIPPMARRLGIPSVMTFHNAHTCRVTLPEIEQTGLDAMEFWTKLYFPRQPRSYEEARAAGPVDLLVSGVFAADVVTTVSPSFLDEVCGGRHSFVAEELRSEVRNKQAAGRAKGILNAPAACFAPERDEWIACRYSARDHGQGKLRNKAVLQRRLGLAEVPQAPLFFWPSRLDPVQKGCDLLAEILAMLVLELGNKDAQVVVVADGPDHVRFRNLAQQDALRARVVAHDFDEALSQLAFAAADFILMPSRYEPCGLPQIIGQRYGALPIVHDTGGLHDTVSMLDVERGTGNGFVFKPAIKEAFLAAVESALAFHALPFETRALQVARIMKESSDRHDARRCASAYRRVYEQLLACPLPRRGGKVVT